jgi:hypothetical protein
MSLINGSNQSTPDPGTGGNHNALANRHCVDGHAIGREDADLSPNKQEPLGVTTAKRAHNDPSTLSLVLLDNLCTDAAVEMTDID